MNGRSQLRHVALATLLAAALSAIAATPAWPLPATATAQARARIVCAHTGARPTRVSLRRLRISTRCLINRARKRHGLSGLRVSRKLRRVATGHSRAMARYNFFSHGPTASRIARTGYFVSASSWAYGEVLGSGCHHDGSAKLVFRRWMRSSGHRAAILTGRFREIGVGVARGSPFGGGHRKCATYTVDLGVNR